MCGFCAGAALGFCTVIASVIVKEMVSEKGIEVGIVAAMVKEKASPPIGTDTNLATVTE